MITKEQPSKKGRAQFTFGFLTNDARATANSLRKPFQTPDGIINMQEVFRYTEKSERAYCGRTGKTHRWQPAFDKAVPFVFTMIYTVERPTHPNKLQQDIAELFNDSDFPQFLFTSITILPYPVGNDLRPFWDYLYGARDYFAEVSNLRVLEMPSGLTSPGISLKYDRADLE